nr:carboxypeptidase-like regulatory domain-containing protein [candidate division Zixibacteria bacterium]
MKKYYPFTIIINVILMILSAASSFAGIITGTIYDFDSGQPISAATVRVEGTGRSMLANDQGQYRLRLDPGKYQLKFSHIAHYSETVEIEIPDSNITLDVRLRQSVQILKGMKVYQRAYDPAQKIIVQAIDRKKDLLSLLHDYSFEAYARLVVKDKSKADSNAIILITETQLISYWEAPDKYKEIILARKQTSNLPAEGNMVTVGGILDFNGNRMEIERYSVVSPTAYDALDHYNYYLIDTIYVDNKAIFRLEIEPKNQNEPLFVGTIDIVDSSFAVVGVDVGFSEGVELPYFYDIRYTQKYAEFDNNIWMPIEITLGGTINIGFPGIPVMTIDYRAALHRYLFDADVPEVAFDEYAIEVDENADDVDSLEWASGQLIPLTGEEEYGYTRIDSLENESKPLPVTIIRYTMMGLIALLSNYDLFHYNRVEGAYLGLGLYNLAITPELSLHLKSGYAFDGEYWQHNYGFRYLLNKRQRLWVGAEYHDEIVQRPTVVSGDFYNSTFFAFWSKIDHVDYFREKGYRLSLGAKLLNHTRMTLSYNDFNQYSVSNHATYSLFDKDKEFRKNPEITEGKLRSLGAELVWDSRQLAKFKKGERPLNSLPYTIVKAGGELADPDLIGNDFHFSRYYISLDHNFRLFNFGFTNLTAYAGGSDYDLSPQRYFTVDHGGEISFIESAFWTTGETNFIGNRVGSVHLSHDFGRYLFRKSGLPLIKDLPLTLSVHGGAFWTDFKNHLPQTDDRLSLVAGKPYRELGFGIGFPQLLGLKLMLTWQLSNYPTEDFSFGLNMGF